MTDPHDTRDGREPIFNIPRPVVAVIIVLALIHLARSLLSPTLDAETIATFAFVPARFAFLIDPSLVLDALDSLAQQSGGEAQFGQFLLTFPPQQLLWLTPLSYAFLHGDATHLTFNCIWLAAFGAPVARRFGAAGFLALGAIGAVAGALVFFAAHPAELVPLIGASAGVSAFMGAASRFVFQDDAFLGASFRDKGARAAPLAGFQEMIQDRRTLGFVAIWFISNFFLGVGAQSLGFSNAPVAWEAHVGGFLAGLLLAPLFDQRRSAGA